MNYSKLKRIAKDKRMSIKELSEKIGMSETGFHQALNNNTLKVETLEKISDVLEVPIFFLFDSYNNEEHAAEIENYNKLQYITEGTIHLLEKYLLEKYKDEQKTMLYEEYQKKIYTELFEYGVIQEALNAGFFMDKKLFDLWNEYKPKE
jgi:transcriptional regulator with XRE-family HTH domain